VTGTPGELWAVTVDQQRCQGTGLCLSMAPGRFRLVGYRAEPVDPVHPPTEDLLVAAEVCPMEAISFRTDHPEDTRES
jgi:ferredoxin